MAVRHTFFSITIKKQGGKKVNGKKKEGKTTNIH